MKTKILILGATGFIGRNMVNYFAKNPNNEITAVHYKRPAFDCENVKFIRGDLCQSDFVNQVIDECDIIIQAAATTSGSKDIITRPFIHVTDNAVMNSLIFRRAFEQKVKKLIFFSCTVMYPSSDKPLKESDFDANKPLHSRYFGVGNTKLYLEKMGEFFSQIGETQYTMIRHSNIYGPHDKFDLERSHVFGATITKVMQADKNMVIWGTGEEARDLLHVNDLCDFVDCALKNQPIKYGLYNCGSGYAIKIKDLVAKIIQHSGKNLTISHDYSQPSIPTSLFLDCQKAKNDIGWQAKTNLDDGIKDILYWWRAHINPDTLKEIA